MLSQGCQLLQQLFQLAVPEWVSSVVRQPALPFPLLMEQTIKGNKLFRCFTAHNRQLLAGVQGALVTLLHINRLAPRIHQRWLRRRIRERCRASPALGVVAVPCLGQIASWRTVVFTSRLHPALKFKLDLWSLQAGGWGAWSQQLPRRR